MRVVLNTALIILMFLIAACEEDFNLKTDYVPKYALNCIIRGDTSYQTATLLKSYDVDGFDPYIYTEDPFLSGADIKIWRRENVYMFRDSSVQRADTTRFKFPQKFYYLNNFAPASDDFLEIKAILENGKVLTGVTTIPKKVKWDTSGTRILKPGSDKFSVRWIRNDNFGWFLLRLKLNYRIGWGPTQSVEIPIRFEGDTPVYPTATRNTGIAYDWAAFERIIKGISENEPDKSQFLIFGISSELLIFDESLSKYYSNMKGYMDDFTIRVDQNDYSNIEGGFGIFGSYIKQIGGIIITESYITSLGYRHQ